MLKYLGMALTLGVLVAAGPAIALPIDSARNLADFDFVVDKISRNYAGYPSKTAGERSAVLAELTARLRVKAAAANDDELRAILKEWTGFFGDGHIGVTPGAAPSNAAKTPRRRLTEARARRQIAALGERRDPVEGIWSIAGDTYRVAVLRRSGAADRFDAVVLSTTADNWQPGQIKAELRRDTTGYSARYRSADHSAEDLPVELLADGAVLSVGPRNNWRRELPAIADAAAIERRVPANALFLRPLSPTTFWLRVPDFNDSRARPLRALLDANRATLATTPNLIIDLRGNGGGSDYVYAPLLQLLYTRPVVSIGVEMRASADNLSLRKAVADAIRAEAPEAAADLDAQNVLMAAKGEGFFSPQPLPFSIERQAKIEPFPKQVAVLIDGAGSTGEQFLLDARQSRKVTLFGQSNSAGVLDFANVVGMPTTSGRYNLFWATSRSQRLPHDPVDPDGIAPDVRIPADERDPVAYAQRWLERRPTD